MSFRRFWNSLSGVERFGLITGYGILAPAAIVTCMAIQDIDSPITFTPPDTGGLSADDAPNVENDELGRLIAELETRPIISIVPKNPGQRVPVQQQASSVGVHDERETAYTHQDIFDPVGRTNTGCTETLVEIPQHSVLNNDAIFVTAAHCVDNPYGTITINGTYQDANGVVHSYSANSQEIWIHPFYEIFRQDSGVTDDRRYTPFDIAIVRVSRSDIPSAVEPSNLNPIDFAVTPPSSFNGEVMSSLGYSADLAVLSYHNNCIVENFTYRDFQTTCDFTGGASGGNFTKPFDPDALERLEIYGINGGAGGEHGYHSFLESSFLSTIPFLVPNEGSYSLECAAVNSPPTDSDLGGLNRRFGPGTSSEDLPISDTEFYSALDHGAVVAVFNTFATENEGNWSFVQPIGPDAKDQNYAYVSATYLVPTPCPARL